LNKEGAIVEKRKKFRVEISPTHKKGADEICKEFIDNADPN
jgi:hypothetical protein